MEYDKPYQYGTRVLVSHWTDRQEGFPLDNPKPNYTGASHYRTFGSSNTLYMPKTTTQEQQETGLRKARKHKRVAKKEVNLVSFSLSDLRVKHMEDTHKPDEPLPPLISTYNAVYKRPSRVKQRKEYCEDKVLDPLLNRIPKSDFEMLPSSTHKFMDDQFTMLSEGRKKINFLRQIRNSTYFMGEQNA